MEAEYQETVERGWRVKSLWNGALGVIKHNIDLRRSSGEVEVLWDTGETTKEVWKCDIEHLP